MTTLEKIEKKHKLEMELHELESEIRDEQRKCKHEHKETPSFNTEFFYADCIKCGHRVSVKHGVNISTNDLYKLNKDELQFHWDNLILNK